MRHDEIVHSKPALLLTCPAVRVTPYGQDARPDHSLGFTYRFEEPVTLAYLHRMALPKISGETALRYTRRRPSLAALIAPTDHPQRTDLGYINRYIRLRVGAHVAVELWTPREDGWAYTLFPYWRHAPADDWPREPDPDAPVYCLGETIPSPSAWTWPAPGLPGYDVQAGTSAIMASTSAPPPPPGLPTVSADTARVSGGARRTPVRSREGTGVGPCPTSADTARTPAGIPATDTPRAPGPRDTTDTRRTLPDADSGQGVRVEYRARVPRRQLGAALAEALAHITRRTRPDTPRTPPDTGTPDTARPLSASRREESAAAIAAAFDLPAHLLRKDIP